MSTIQLSLFDIEVNVSLPDPDSNDFLLQSDGIWNSCENVSLQSDIMRGRTLRQVRERFKSEDIKAFTNWLKTREITKAQAYKLIQLANTEDELSQVVNLTPDVINRFSQNAFLETAKVNREVQAMIGEAAGNGDRITKREVKSLNDEWIASSSDLLPEEIKEKVGNGTLPSKYVAPFVKELEKLPDEHLKDIQESVAQAPDIENIKYYTKEAKNLAKYLELATTIQAVQSSKQLSLNLALEEALRLDCLDVAASVLKQASAVEQAAAKLMIAWQRLNRSADRLYVETGASTPHLRELLSAVSKLSGDTITVPLNESGDQVAVFQVLSEIGVE